MNIKYVLKKRPFGIPEADIWERQTEPIPQISEGEVLIKHHYISLDPAMRGWMNEGKSYIEPVNLGDVMRAGTVGIVEASKHPNIKVGEFITGWGGVQNYTVTNGKGWHKIDAKLAPLPMYLGVLGMTGMTAYFGILEVGKISTGDIVLVSGAAGAVGSVVGQIAKLKGCTVIGIAGGQEKCRYLTETLGFDAALDYKSDSFVNDLKQACPKGIDVFFDNVGGEILDLALTKLRRHARVVICGAISQYNTKTRIKGPGNYLSLLVNRATMQGMVVFDFADKYLEAAQHMAGWIQSGQLKSEETIIEGIDNFHNSFLKLFSGDKQGKLLLKVV
ncbi:NADP-dependent oxidoreductase [Geojedonia litorea]|uniref:NADP-dependent oxidoreductase n=1 Tax=Geojedonia litorea TaxID=1268269 RepID=A0ABV9N5C1_9FLAO